MVYHSKVVILCWAVIFVAATVAAFLKRRWAGLRHIVVGATIVAIGIALSALLKNEIGALMLSAALLISTYFALTGIIKTFSKE